MCKKVPQMLKLPLTLKEFIERNLRVVFRKGRNVGSVLLNSRQQAQKEKFLCLGPPFCQDSHLSVPLENFNEKGKRVSAVGLSYVPAPDLAKQKETLVFALVSWIVRLARSQGLLSLDDKVPKIFWEKCLPIIKNRRVLSFVTCDRYAILRSRYVQQTKNESEQEFIKELILLSRRYPLSFLDGGRMHERLLYAINDSFTNVTERYCSPFSFCLPRFATKFIEDRVFGATNPNYWEGINVASPGSSQCKIQNCVKEATNAVAIGTISFLFLPDMDKDWFKMAINQNCIRPEME
jgi:hypothetical protein